MCVTPLAFIVPPAQMVKGQFELQTVQAPLKVLAEGTEVGKLPLSTLQQIEVQMKQDLERVGMVSVCECMRACVRACVCVCVCVSGVYIYVCIVCTYM